MNIIETHNLTKRYRDFTAVNKLNMHVKKGQVYGFLGPNGAGKSTTMKMFLGLTRPSSGDFQIKGLSYPKDRMEILRQTGAFIESPSFYGNLTGEENLEIIRRILQLPKDSVRDALELTGLYEFRKRLASKYSLGMKQRLGLAEALLGRPPVLILDEPTNGLDPAGIRQLRDILKETAHRDGTAVLVSSHLMSEMELMCDRVGLIVNGEIRDIKPIGELIQEACGGSAAFLYRTDRAETAARLLREKIPELSARLLTEHEFLIYLKNQEKGSPETAPLPEPLSLCNRLLIEAGISLYTVSEYQDHTLEDAFIRLTEEGGSQIV